MNHARITIDSDVTPRFTACYLRTAGEECAFIEAHTAHALPRLLAALKSAGRRPEEVKWIFITHVHLDHAAGASALVGACPNATILAHPRAARHLIDPSKLVKSAKMVYGAERFAELYGTVEPIDASRVRALDDGASVTLGDATMRVFHTAGHANHHFIVDDPAVETVFSGDTFGVIYPDLQAGGRFALPSTSPTNFDAALAKESVAKVVSLREKFVCPTHFDAYDDAPRIAEQLVRFLDRAGQWVEEASHSSESVAVITKRLQNAWTAAIREEAPHFGERELKLLALDIELNAQGLAVVADAKRTAPMGRPR